MGFRKQLIKVAFSNTTKLALQNISLRTRKVLGKPTGIFIAITNRCNLKCKQCDVPFLAGRHKELSTEQWKKILRELHDWLGITIIRWSGGEPFLRKDMLELLKYSAELGTLNSVITNGQLINRELASKIVESRVFNISLSIDGMQKGHDFVRGGGTFEKVTAASRFLNEVRRIKKSDMRIMIKVTIMQSNFYEILDLVDWVEKEGLNGISISPLMETLATTNPNSRWFEESPLWVKDLKQLDHVIDCLVERAGPGSAILNPKSYLKGIKEYFHDPTVPKPADFTCHVGHDHFRIDPNGDVYLCPMISSALVGNLVESTPQEIWRSSEAAVSRRDIENCRRNCHVPCQYKRTLRENAEFFLRQFKFSK